MSFDVGSFRKVFQIFLEAVKLQVVTNYSLSKHMNKIFYWDNFFKVSYEVIIENIAFTQPYYRFQHER